MFESRYYKHKYVYNNKGKLCLFELNLSRVEAYIIFKAEDGKNDIVLRDLKTRPLTEDDALVSLKSYLIDNGYNDKDFANPFTRTQKIINELYNNSKNKVYKKR